MKATPAVSNRESPAKANKLTPMEAARTLGVTRNTVQNWTQGITVCGTKVILESESIGARIFIAPEAITRFLENCRRARTGQPFDAPESPDKERQRMERETAEALKNW